LSDGIISSFDDVVGVDIEPSFFEIGYEMFRDKEQIKKIMKHMDFVNEDKKTLAQQLGFESKFSNIFCGSVIHLLPDPESIERLCSNAFYLLENQGIFFGRTVGQKEAGVAVWQEQKDSKKYLHSSASLKQTLEKCGFVNVKIEADLERGR
jgi:hypothetical protein